MSVKLAAMELVTIASLRTPTDAHLLRTLLESEGIAAFIFNEQISNTFLPLETAYGGVQLQVSAEDAERAREIIARVDGEEVVSAEE